MAYYNPNTWAEYTPDQLGSAAGLPILKSAQPQWDSMSRVDGAINPLTFAQEFSPSLLGSNDLRKTFDDTLRQGGRGSTADFINRLNITPEKATQGMNEYYRMTNTSPNDAKWWGDQGWLKAYGSGLDSLGTPSNWQKYYDPALNARQGQALAQNNMSMQNTTINDSDDLMDILKGVSAVVGAGAASGAFAGLGAGAGAGAGATGSGAAEAGLGYGGYGGAGGTIADFSGTLGNVPWGVNPQGGNMDWWDLINEASSGETNPFWGNAGGANVAPDALQAWTNAGGTGAADVGGSAGTNLPGSFVADGTQAGSLSAQFQQYLGNLQNGINQPPGLSTALQKIFGGSGTSGGRSGNFLTDLLGRGNSSALGGALSSILGYKSAQDQSKSYTDLANKYSEYGAPYRSQLSSLMANPDGFINSNEVQMPVQQGTNALMRSLSTSGNPFGSGNALQQGQNFASNSFYDKLQGKENQLAGFGGLTAYNAAAPGAANNAIGAQANPINAIGVGVNDIFKPPTTLAENLAAYKQMMGG